MTTEIRAIKSQRLKKRLSGRARIAAVAFEHAFQNVNGGDPVMLFKIIDRGEKKSVCSPRRNSGTSHGIELPYDPHHAHGKDWATFLTPLEGTYSFDILIAPCSALFRLVGLATLSDKVARPQVQNNCPLQWRDLAPGWGTGPFPLNLGEKLFRIVVAFQRTCGGGQDRLPIRDDHNESNYSTVYYLPDNAMDLDEENRTRNDQEKRGRTMVDDQTVKGKLENVEKRWLTSKYELLGSRGPSVYGSVSHDLELEESEWISIYKAFSAASHARMGHVQAALQLS
ncbi:hypothetical protein B0H13DRAFT_1884671 [Mycena leptocephala]|nr:hypothetical protein B0H13DRAFT_1884671 [Mycena leptocephala]